MLDLGTVIESVWHGNGIVLVVLASGEELCHTLHDDVDLYVKDAIGAVINVSVGNYPRSATNARMWHAHIRVGSHGLIAFSTVIRDPFHRWGGTDDLRPRRCLT